MEKLKKSLIIGIVLFLAIISGAAGAAAQYGLVILPQKDIYVESLVLEKQQVLAKGTQKATATIRNTNDDEVWFDFKIKIIGPNAANSLECVLPPQSILGNSNLVEPACEFGPGTSFPLLFDTKGIYKAVGEISNVNPPTATPITLNDFAERFFSVEQETKAPIPETDLLLVPAIAALALFVVSRQRAKKSAFY